jgi:hypothetical protein
LDQVQGVDIDSLGTNEEKVDILLRQVLAAATRELYNATEWSKRESREKDEAAFDLAQAQMELEEAEQEVARLELLPFSEAQARARRSKVQLGREVEAAQVIVQHATNTLEQANTAMSECLSVLDSVHRIENKQPRITLEALIAEASGIFEQLGVRLPGQGDLVQQPGSYDYYDEESPSPNAAEPPPTLVAQHALAQPPPSPSAPADSLKDLKEIAGKQVEALELQIVKHPVFALGVGLVGLVLLLVFIRCCYRSRSPQVVDVAESDLGRIEDDRFDDDEGTDDEFEEIEMEENGHGRRRAGQNQEKETLTLSTSYIGEQNGSRKGRSSRAHRIP